MTQQQNQQPAPDVVRIAEAAHRLGVTEGALRLRVHRLMNQGAACDLPRPVKVLGKWAWARQDFEAWLAFTLAQKG